MIASGVHVVDDAFVASFDQAPHHIGAHASQSDHAELHFEAPCQMCLTTLEGLVSLTPNMNSESRHVGKTVADEPQFKTERCLQTDKFAPLNGTTVGSRRRRLFP